MGGSSGHFELSGLPVIDVCEDKHNVIVKVEIPGVKKEEIEVYFTEGLLNIAGERKEESDFKEAESYRSERYFDRFHRSITLLRLWKLEKSRLITKMGF